MKKLLVATVFGLALTGCEGFNDRSKNPVGPSTSGKSVEERAQQCANQGMRPGTEKFRLCLERPAANAVSTAPVPMKKPVKAAAAKTKAKAGAEPDSWGSSMMKKIGGLFN